MEEEGGAGECQVESIRSRPISAGRSEVEAAGQVSEKEKENVRKNKLLLPREMGKGGKLVGTVSRVFCFLFFSLPFIVLLKRKKKTEYTTKHIFFVRRFTERCRKRKR